MTTYQELLSQRKALEKQIEEARKQELSQVIAQVQALMSQYGLTPSDLTDPVAQPSGKRSKVAAKYRNSLTGETWTGRGRQPKWVQAALASGKTLTDLSI